LPLSRFGPLFLLSSPVLSFASSHSKVSMPPKGSGLAGFPGLLPKAKGKAKGKGKSKSKAKAKAKAKARLMAAQAAAMAAAQAAAAAAVAAGGEAGEVIEGAPAAPDAEAAAAAAYEAAMAQGMELAIPSPKAKANPMKKKAANMLYENENVDEVISEQKTKLQQAAAELDEKEALEKAQIEQVETAKKECDQATKESQDAIDAEMKSAATYKEFGDKKQTVQTAQEEKRNDLYTIQKKVAQMEVMLVNETRMKELKERQEAAAKAAEDAKRHLLMQRQKEKEALEDTRKALAAMKGKGGKAAGRGVKRPAEEMSKPAHPDEADTLAATQLQSEGAASQDID